MISRRTYLPKWQAVLITASCVRVGGRASGQSQLHEVVATNARPYASHSQLLTSPLGHLGRWSLGRWSMARLWPPRPDISKGPAGGIRKPP